MEKNNLGCHRRESTPPIKFCPTHHLLKDAAPVKNARPSPAVKTFSGVDRLPGEGLAKPSPATYLLVLLAFTAWLPELSPSYTDCLQRKQALTHVLHTQSSVQKLNLMQFLGRE